MYSQKLEDLIEIVLADGVITEKERAVLYRKADEEGIDIDEFEVVLEGRLAKIRKDQGMSATSTNPPPPPQQKTYQSPGQSKHGTVSKCPRCGAVIEAASVRCSLCQYEFRGVDAISSIQLLEMRLFQAGEKYRYSDDVYEAAQAEIISNFPIPNTREDLLEFCVLTLTRGKNDDEDMVAYAYFKKSSEAIEKAKIFFPNDPQFERLFHKHNRMKLLSPFVLAFIKWITIIVGILLFLFIFQLLGI